MDDLTVLALIGAAVLGLLAVLSLLRRERHEAEAIAGDVEAHSFAVPTEGMKRCPNCGMGNLIDDRTCASCKKPLRS
jgi:hypothetical protein